MNLSRRELPAVFLMAAPRLQAAQNADQHLSSKVYVFDKLQVRHGDAFEYRQLAEGKTVDGCKFSVHESALQPGHEPHPPHHHNGEEIFMMLEGTLEVTINGNSSRIAKGSVAFVGSGDQHGIRNPGPGLAKYFVIELGPQR
jgi:mannose-6-phosphate isomerase-like protein (cupin superfamily)